jgi:hypothetical protein
MRTMNYQDQKVRDAGRLALMAVGLGAAAAVFVSARELLGPLLGAYFMPTVAVMIALCPVTATVCVWFLLSSPAQDAAVLRWAERNFGYKRPSNYDPTLIDPADPAYGVRTIQYAVGRTCGGR